MTHSVTHSYVWHDSFSDSFVCVTWLIQWLIRMCDMTHSVTHSYVWHDSFVCVTWLIQWLIRMCDMTHSVTHSYVWHDSWVDLRVHVWGFEILQKKNSEINFVRSQKLIFSFVITTVSVCVYASFLITQEKLVHVGRTNLFWANFSFVISKDTHTHTLTLVGKIVHANQFFLN